MSHIDEILFHDQKLTIKFDKKGLQVNCYLYNESKWMLNITSQLIWMQDWIFSESLKILEFNQTNSKIKMNIKGQETYPFDTELVISSSSSIPWIKISVSLISLKNSIFKTYGPEIRLKLKPKFLSDDAIYITQPTKHTPVTDEWKSNDFPAIYFWNPNSKIETFFFVDFTNMSWMDHSTFERFSIYECGYNGKETIGLIHRVPLKSPIELKKGTRINYDFYITQSYRDNKPSKWDAVYALITRSFSLLPSRVPFPQECLTWKSIVEGCINDLMKEGLCWYDKKTPMYHAYVMDESELNKRGDGELKAYFETMTMLDILPPWLTYLEFEKRSNVRDHVFKICNALKHFIEPSTKILKNMVFVHKGQYQFRTHSEKSIGDSWYFFEPILRFGWLIKILKPSELRKKYLESFLVMVDRAIAFTKEHNYRIHAFYDPITLKPLADVMQENVDRRDLYYSEYQKSDIDWKKIAKNFACLGVHSYIMIEAFYFTKKVNYLNESIKTIQELRKISPDELFWEPLELAYGVASLGELYRITRKEEYLEFGMKLLHNELRMFYWYDDNSYSWKGKRSNLGLVMACVGIRYPAMKENLESIYPWTILLKMIIQDEKNHYIPKGILNIFNLVRINSFYYFSNILPEELIYPSRRKTPCPYIPFEDLEMLETADLFSRYQPESPKGKRSGTLGREIYGAGEVIWLYLLFEFFARCDNNEIMILNLDLFDIYSPDSFAFNEFNFLIYNPLKKNVCTKVTFPKIQEGYWTVLIQLLNGLTKSMEFGENLTSKNNFIEIEMECDSAYTLKIIKKIRAVEQKNKERIYALDIL